MDAIKEAKRDLTDKIKKMTRKQATEGNPMTCGRCGWNGVTEMYFPYKYCVRWRCAKCHRRIA